jgi:hypothetical protein
MQLRMVVASTGLAAVLAVTGCSGGGGAKVATLGEGASSDSSSTTSSDAQQSFEDAMVAYTSCMRDHGVDLPDPTFKGTGSGGDGGGMVIANNSASDGGEAGKGPGPDDPAFRAADESCKPILDAATKDMPKPSPEEEAKMRDQALAFAKCMREHGVDMPDPTFDENGGASIQIAGGPPDGSGKGSGGPDGALQAASEACQPAGGGPVSAAGNGPVLGFNGGPVSS